MSAHIAIRCDECGLAKFGGPFDQFSNFRDLISRDGWESNSRIDYCPTCAARRKAREKAKEANAQS